MRKKINAEGFSIIEALVAILILAASALFIASISKSSFQFLSGMEKTQSISTTMEDIKRVIKSPAICTLNLKGTPITIADTAGAPLTALRMFDKNKQPMEIVANVGATEKGLTLSDLRLIPIAKVDDNLLVTRLKIEFTKMSGEQTQKVSRNIPIYVRIQSGKITECFQRYDQGSVEASQICRALSDGSLNSVDDSQCTLQNAKWFFGNQSSATCPAGTYLNEGANANSNCRCTALDGFTDSFQVNSKKLTDGTTATYSRPPALTNLNAKSATCSCVPAADLSATQKSMLRTAILCVVP